MRAPRNPHCLVERVFESHDGTPIKWFDIGDGPTLVISLPIGLHPDFLRPLTRLLADDFRMVYLQSRGLWGSGCSHLSGGNSLDSHARDIAALIDAAGPDRYSMIGYCGGTPAMLQARDYCRTPADRTLIISSLFRRGGLEKIIEKLISRISDEGRPDTYRAVLSLAFRYGTPEFRDRAMAELSTVERLRIFLDQLLSLYQYEFPISIGPVTIVITEEDVESIRTSSLEFFQVIDDGYCRMIDIPGLGHFFINEEPNIAADFLRSWYSTTQTEAV
jgi:pimeloyl-ACP methyl ester carboxylesterase